MLHDTADKNGEGRALPAQTEVPALPPAPAKEAAVYGAMLCEEPYPSPLEQ